MALAQFLESSASEGSLFEEASIDMMLNDQAEDERQDDPIAKRETRAVMNLKVLVAFVLLCCTVGTAYAVYHFATEAEESKFEAQFEDDAHKVLEAIGSHLDIAFGSLDALFVSMLSFAQATNQSWPFVTIPDFGIRSAKIRSMSGLIYITHLPLVTPENRLDWEAYSIEHGGWVNESMKIQENHDQYYGPVIYDFELYGVIHGDFADVPYSTRYVEFSAIGWSTRSNFDVHSFTLTSFFLSYFKADLCYQLGRLDRLYLFMLPSIMIIYL